MFERKISKYKEKIKYKLKVNKGAEITLKIIHTKKKLTGLNSQKTEKLHLEKKNSISKQ